jgi:hypothetical protein
LFRREKGQKDQEKPEENVWYHKNYRIVLLRQEMSNFMVTYHFSIEPILNEEKRGFTFLQSKRDQKPNSPGELTPDVLYGEIRTRDTVTFNDEDGREAFRASLTVSWVEKDPIVGSLSVKIEAFVASLNGSSFDTFLKDKTRPSLLLHESVALIKRRIDSAEKPTQSAG